MTFASFRGFGQCPSLVIALSRCKIALRPSGGSSPNADKHTYIALYTPDPGGRAV
jgi:hypothetical protein